LSKSGIKPMVRQAREEMLSEFSRTKKLDQSGRKAGRWTWQEADGGQKTWVPVKAGPVGLG
jgi:hypothetical protein